MPREATEHEIVWGGQPYVPLLMDAQGFEMNTKDALPQPNITISNIYGAGNLLLDRLQRPGRRRSGAHPDAASLPR